MALGEELKHRYEVLVKAHFIYRGWDYSDKNVERGVRDLVFFRDFYDTVEEVLENIYPKEENIEKSKSSMP